MWEITLDDKLHLAPIDPSLEQVLDIGTGNGKRVIDFGSTPHFFPKHKYILNFLQSRSVRVNPHNRHRSLIHSASMVDFLRLPYLLSCSLIPCKDTSQFRIHDLRCRR